MSTPQPQAPLTRLYIRTAPFPSPAPSTLTDPNLLPLLSTLPSSTQANIKGYHFHRDAQLSLGSALLKHYYVHQTTGLGWRDVYEGFTRRGDEKHGKPSWRRRVRVAEKGNGTEGLTSIELSAGGEVPEPEPASAQQSPYQPQHQDQAPSQSTEADYELEFNVSHQAGLVALIGLDHPLPIPQHPPFHPHPSPHPHSHPHPHPEHPKPTPILPAPPSPTPTTAALAENAQRSLGIDITAPTEQSRPQSRISTQSDFEDWVDNFADVFSAGEMREMKAGAAPHSSPDIANPQDGAARIKAKLRKFYTHWALKEAYIKMTGEALLADWLRELEFRDVVAPPISEGGAWGTVVWSRGYDRGQGAGEGEGEEEGFGVLFRGSRVRGVTMGVRYLGSEWIVATCVRDEGGTEFGKEEEERWNELTIQDIEPCAKGICRCETRKVGGQVGKEGPEWNETNGSLLA